MTRNIIAVVVLMGLAAAAYFVFRDSPGAMEEKKEVRAVLTPIPRASIDRIEVVRHEGTGDTLREEAIVLERAGDAWKMLEPVEYAVNSTSVENMLEALEEMRVIDVIATNKDQHHVLEVDDEMGVEVTVRGGNEELAHFIVGVSRKNMTMVRIPGGDTVYRASGSFRSTFNKSAKNIREKTVTKLERGTVSRLKFVNDKGELELVRTGEKPADREGMAPVAVFEPVGVEIENFNERLAAGTANSLTGLVARDFVDQPLPDDVTGLGEGAPRVEFDASSDGKKGTYTIWVGNTDEKSRQTYIKTSMSDQIFLVSAHMVTRYNASAQDFARTDEQVKQEEEARAAAAAHAEEHRQHDDMMKQVQSPGGPAPGASAGANQIPPEVMEKIRAQMEKQGAQGQAGQDPAH